jgi:hypothetical protein
MHPLEALWYPMLAKDRDGFRELSKQAASAELGGENASPTEGRFRRMDLRLATRCE